MNTVFTRTLSVPEPDEREILRYAGVRGRVDISLPHLADCIRAAREVLTYRVCYTELSITRRGEMLDLGFMETEARGIKKRLEGCDGILLFAATVGIELDRLIAKYSAVSPAWAMLLQAIGSERVESLCDSFCRRMSEEKAAHGLRVYPRFSPGYGDFPLEAQRAVFSVLDCPRRIGITLNDSLLMTPSKSVTAIMGVGKAYENN